MENGKEVFGMKPISRREFGKTAGLAAMGTAIAGCAQTGGRGEAGGGQTQGSGGKVEPSDSASQSAETARAGGRKFPAGFFWGVATSAYQIEGAWNADGKGPSIWDTYAHTPGKIANNDNGDLANDHYRRYQEDVALMQDIGANAYRFSIAWPRIFPQGTGAPNQKGVDFYKRLTDALREKGLEPFATLYHWDLPQALQDRHGGWRSRETAKAFGDYAGYIAAQLGDRVKHYFTINEFNSFVEMGYRGRDVTVGGGKKKRFEAAPGIDVGPAEIYQVRHHAVLGNGLAVQALRAQAPAGTKAGPAENIQCAVPLIETPEHIEAARTATRELNAPFLTVMLEGRYTDAYLKEAGPNAPKITDEDMKIIGSPLDFVGINVYKPSFYALAGGDRGWQQVEFSKSHPRMFNDWLALAPECIYWAPKFVQTLWGAKEIYITENGCASDEAVAGDGKVYDTDRIMYMRNHLTQLQRATADGVPAKGYFYWSLMDNFEWFEGFGNRFGLVRVDFKTQQRTPKLSALWFREAARRNAVV